MMPVFDGYPYSKPHQPLRPPPGHDTTESSSKKRLTGRPSPFQNNKQVVEVDGETLCGFKQEINHDRSTSLMTNQQQGHRRPSYYKPKAFCSQPGA